MWVMQYLMDVSIFSVASFMAKAHAIKLNTLYTLYLLWAVLCLESRDGNQCPLWVAPSGGSGQALVVKLELQTFDLQLRREGEGKEWKKGGGSSGKRGCWKVTLLDSRYPVSDLEQAALHLCALTSSLPSGVDVTYLSSITCLLMRCCVSR